MNKARREPSPNTSHHLEVLRQARLVETTRAGHFITYHLADAAVADLLLQMRAVADPRLMEIGAMTRAYVERSGLLEAVDQEELFRRLEAGVVEWRARVGRRPVSSGRTAVRHASTRQTTRSGRMAR